MVSCTQRVTLHLLLEKKVVTLPEKRVYTTRKANHINYFYLEFELYYKFAIRKNNLLFTKMATYGGECMRKFQDNTTRHAKDL